MGSLKSQKQNKKSSIDIFSLWLQCSWQARCPYVPAVRREEVGSKCGITSLSFPPKFRLLCFEQVHLPLKCFFPSTPTFKASLRLLCSLVSNSGSNTSCGMLWASSVFLVDVWMAVSLAHSGCSVNLNANDLFPTCLAEKPLGVQPTPQFYMWEDPGVGASSQLIAAGAPLSINRSPRYSARARAPDSHRQLPAWHLQMDD
jgi:hypothetical protein